MKRNKKSRNWKWNWKYNSNMSILSYKCSLSEQTHILYPIPFSWSIKNVSIVFTFKTHYYPIPFSQVPKGHCAIWPIFIPQIWWFLKYINLYICVHILKYYYVSVNPVTYLAAWSLVSYRKVITYIPTQGAVNFITMWYIY